MKIAFNWLKQFINIEWDVNKTSELLTDLGLEVEGVTPFESIKGGLEGIVVGHVLTCEQHPNADKLSKTTVDIGEEAPLPIVCGAPNVAAGQKVLVATIGTVLYDDKGDSFKIKKGKIRGEASHGMICAEDELGLGDSHDGIMVLDQDIAVGTKAADIFEIENDHIIEIGLTPNRADAMSHYGVARDLKAGLAQHDLKPELITPSVMNFHVENRTLKVDVDVANTKLTPRYCGVVISGIKVAPSPTWLQNRLKSIGLAPKNNIVDITNYVMHELGQPLHAFDQSKIGGNKVIVKTVAAGTKFTTLDEVERTLHEDDLMICDEHKPLCIAGVLGGLDSGINDNTTNVFLESAYFDPVSIRKTAKRHGINTDASFRFERGIDPNFTKYALKRATLLIQEIAGGIVTSDIIDLYPTKFEDHQVVISFDNVNKLIGQELSKSTIQNILASLDIKVNSMTETGMGLTIPPYRVDVQREADVIEEILRVYGYNNIEFSQKLNASIARTSKFDDHRIQNKTADQLAGMGFYEIMTNSLTTPRYVGFDESLSEEANVTMMNPLGQELSVLRQSILFSGLEAIGYNINRRNANLRLFEFAKTYHKTAEGSEEKKHLAVFVTGNTNEDHWSNPSKPSSFFYLKASIENILQRLNINTYTNTGNSNTALSEGITYVVNNKEIATLGVVKKKVLKAFDIDQQVLFADIDWDAILKLIKKQTISYSEIAKFPAVKRDFSLLIDQSTSFEEIAGLAKKTEKKLLKNVSLFDVYEGKKLPEGKKSYAVSFTLQDENKTLTDKQIDKIMSKIQKSLETNLDASLR